MIQCECPHCGKALQVPRQYAGKKGRCKGCGKVFTAPPLSEDKPDNGTPGPDFADFSMDLDSTPVPRVKRIDSAEAYVEHLLDKYLAKWKALSDAQRRKWSRIAIASVCSLIVLIVGSWAIGELRVRMDPSRYAHKYGTGEMAFVMSQDFVAEEVGGNPELRFDMYDFRTSGNGWGTWSVEGQFTSKDKKGQEKKHAYACEMKFTGRGEWVLKELEIRDL